MILSVAYFLRSGSRRLTPPRVADDPDTNTEDVTK